MPLGLETLSPSLQDWGSTLKKPVRPEPMPHLEYPVTALGQLAYHLRELFDRSENHPRPTTKQLCYTAYLVKEFARELQTKPLTDRSATELALINFVVTPRILWPEARPHAEAAQAAIYEAFFEIRNSLAAVFKHAWSSGQHSWTSEILQQIAINLAISSQEWEPMAALVHESLPAPHQYKVHRDIAPGSFGLLSLAYECGVEDANKLLCEALPVLLGYESLGPTLCPLSRPQEFRLVSLPLSDLVTDHIRRANQKSSYSTWEPNISEAIDIARSWMEGSSYALTNFFRHLQAVIKPELLGPFGQLYCHRGVRNILRLQLSDCDTPWFLANTLAQSCAQPQRQSDVILCAVGSGDHNTAFLERAWEFEELRQQGERDRWALDYVEVRDPLELACHILRHHEEGSRVRVLHYFGHGDAKTAGFGKLDQPTRSHLSLRGLFNNPHQRELCSIIKDSVDAVVLHTCSAASDKIPSSRKAGNIAEALYAATDGQVTVTALKGMDAFRSLNHRRNRRNDIIFTSDAAYCERKTIRSRGESPISNRS